MQTVHKLRNKRKLMVCNDCDLQKLCGDCKSGIVFPISKRISRRSSKSTFIKTLLNNSKTKIYKPTRTKFLKVYITKKTKNHKWSIIN